MTIINDFRAKKLCQSFNDRHTIPFWLSPPQPNQNKVTILVLLLFYQYKMFARCLCSVRVGM